jgi:hypothetical protein
MPGINNPRPGPDALGGTVYGLFPEKPCKYCGYHVGPIYHSLLCGAVAHEECYEKQRKARFQRKVVMC